MYVIGGDGTHRGAYLVSQECISRGLNISVVGIPKTIDNDVDLIDRYIYINISIYILILFYIYILYILCMYIYIYICIYIYIYYFTYISILIHKF